MNNKEIIKTIEAMEMEHDLDFVAKGVVENIEKWFRELTIREKIEMFKHNAWLKDFEEEWTELDYIEPKENL